MWQLPFRVRARFQPCRNCRQINKASAAEGLAFQLPRRLFSPGPAPSGTVYSSPTIARFLRDDSWLCACGMWAVRLPPSSPLRGMRPCGIGFSLCVFPGGGSPGFQSGGARLQACAKSASTRRASESVWQLPFRVRARFQPCRNCCQINKASAAEGLPFQLPRRLFSPGPAPSGTAIPGCAPVECGQSTYRLLRHFGG